MITDIENNNSIDESDNMDDPFLEIKRSRLAKESDFEIECKKKQNIKLECFNKYDKTVRHRLWQLGDALRGRRSIFQKLFIKLGKNSSLFWKKFGNIMGFCVIVDNNVPVWRLYCYERKPSYVSKNIDEPFISVSLAMDENGYPIGFKIIKEDNNSIVVTKMFSEQELVEVLKSSVKNKNM